MQRWYAALVGDGGDDGGDGDGRIFPEHAGPIIHAPRDIISRKGKSLTPIFTRSVAKIKDGSCQAHQTKRNSDARLADFEKHNR